jgi:hypothetical protein
MADSPWRSRVPYGGRGHGDATGADARSRSGGVADPGNQLSTEEYAADAALASPGRG